MKVSSDDDNLWNNVYKDKKRVWTLHQSFIARFLLNLYKPNTLVGPTITRLVQDSLAVAFLDNQLYMLTVSPVFHTEVKDSIGLKTYLRMWTSIP